LASLKSTGKKHAGFVKTMPWNVVPDKLCEQCGGNIVSNGAAEFCPDCEYEYS
jgi:tRNA(Ile2) C34 agmatinyltransferase TiaS